MSSSRGGFGGIAIVLLLAVVAFAALLVLSAAAPASAGAPGAPTGARPPVLTGAQIPSQYRLHLGDPVTLTALGSTPTTAAPASGPGPEPTDLPFAANVAVWTDARNQNRPTEARDSLGRTYLAFQSEVSPTNHDIYVARSDDDGRTWTAPVAVATTTADETNPSIIVTTGDRVTIFLQQDANPAAFAYAQSADRGNTWTIQPIGVSTTPIRNFEYPSFVANGMGAIGMWGVFCTDATNCGGGAQSAFMVWTADISVATGWSGVYFAQPPNVELFHPSAGLNSVTGDLVGSMEIEIFNNAAWDLTWFRFNPTTSFFSQDGLMCGTFCPSNTFVWPSIAVDGNRIITGAHFFNASLAPYTEILAVFSTNGGAAYNLVNGTPGTGQIDSAAQDKKYVSFEIKGANVHAAYWKTAGAGNNAIWYVAATGGGLTFLTPARVSDNTPATAIDQQHAVVVRDSTSGPLVAWHDSRDANANIYFAAFQRYTITLNTNPASLLVRFDGGAWQTAPATGQFPAGTSHTIEGQSPQPGATGVQYVFTQWNDANTNDPRTISVAADATYTATFRTQFQITVASNPTGRTVTVNAAPQTAPYLLWCDASATAALDAPSPQTVTPTSQYRFDSWSDGGAQAHGVLCDAPKTVTANFVRQWQITVASNPAGRDVAVDSVVQTGPYVFWCDDASSRTISAPSPQLTAPGTRYRFDTWSDGQGISHPITCTSSTTITATFILQYQITIGTNPAGRAVTVDGGPQTGPYTNWWDAGATIGLLVPSPQTVGAGSRFSFSAWSDGNVNPSRTLLADQPRSITAVFTTEYFLTISTNAGTVNPGNGWHPENDIVAISTTGPADGLTDRYRFGGWSGDLVWYTTSTTITMDGPKTIAANWVHQFKFDIRFASGVPGTTVTIDGVDVSPNVFWWNESSVHSIAAPATLAATSDTRYNFLSWQGAGANPQFSVTVSNAATYTAQYTRQFLVTLIISPTGPAVTVDGATPTGALWFDEGTQHVFDANANPQPGATGERFRFSAWSGAATGTTPLVTVTMDAPKVLTATYTRQFLLTINSQYGNPTCASPCVAVSGGCWYDESSQAQVSVTSPSAAGGTKFRLTGWSGAATTTALTATVTMDGPKTLTATWAEVSFLEEFGLYLGLLIAILVAVIGLVLFVVMRRRKKEPPVAAAPPPPPAAGMQQTSQAGGTKTCPACGMEIPGAASTCPVCGSAV